MVIWRRKKQLVKVYVFERADFTDPMRVTGVLEADLPKSRFLGRLDVWRSSQGSSGPEDPEAFIALQTGADIVTPTHKLRGRESEPGVLFKLENENVLFAVADGKYIQDFRYHDDYDDLPVAEATFHGNAAKARWLWYNKVAEAGRARGALGRNRVVSFLGENWMSALGLGLCVIGILLLMFR